MTAQAPTSIEAAAEWLRKHFDPEAARGEQIAYQLELSGPGGGSLSLRIDDGVLDVRRGDAEPTAVRIRLATADAFAIFAGRENAELLALAGRIRIDGDPALALRMRTFFRRRA